MLPVATPMAVWLKMLIFSAQNHSSSYHCWLEPCSGHTWDKSSSACGWSGFFSLGSPIFRPTLRLTKLKMSELILTGHKTQIKKKLSPFSCVMSHLGKCVLWKLGLELWNIETEYYSPFNYWFNVAMATKGALIFCLDDTGFNSA